MQEDAAREAVLLSNSRKPGPQQSRWQEGPEAACPSWMAVEGAKEQAAEEDRLRFQSSHEKATEEEFFKGRSH